MKKILTFSSLIFILVLTLSAWSSSQVLPTTLRITILDELGNVVEGASVTLYTADADYRAEKNSAAGPEVTDKKGRVTFKKLAPRVYYVLAKKDDLSNAGAGAQTDTLDAKKVNKVNIIVY